MNNEIDEQNMTIGRLADAAGVNVETIRYYQRIGLINEPEKPVQGFRKYSHQSIEQIKFIKRAKQLGFSLQEIADLLALGSGQCSGVRKRAEQKRDKIQKQIQDLQTLQTTLDLLIRACRTGNSKKKCPIVESLLEHDI